MEMRDYSGEGLGVALWCKSEYSIAPVDSFKNKWSNFSSETAQQIPFFHFLVSSCKERKHKH